MQVAIASSRFIGGLPPLPPISEASSFGAAMQEVDWLVAGPSARKLSLKKTDASAIETAHV